MKINYSSSKISSKVMSIQNKEEKKTFLGFIQIMGTMILLMNLSIDIFYLNNVLLKYCLIH